VTTTPSRRTVLRATAWTAPAIAVVAAAPAYAVSAEPDTTIGLAAAGPDSYPSIRYLEWDVTVTNPTPDPVVITVTYEVTAGLRGGETCRNGWQVAGFATFSRSMAPYETSPGGSLYVSLSAGQLPPNSTLSMTMIATAPGLTTKSAVYSGTI